MFCGESDHESLPNPSNTSHRLRRSSTPDDVVRVHSYHLARRLQLPLCDVQRTVIAIAAASVLGEDG